MKINLQIISIRLKQRCGLLLFYEKKHCEGNLPILGFDKVAL